MSWLNGMLLQRRRRWKECSIYFHRWSIFPSSEQWSGPNNVTTKRNQRNVASNDTFRGTSKKLSYLLPSVVKATGPPSKTFYFFIIYLHDLENKFLKTLFLSHGFWVSAITFFFFSSLPNSFPFSLNSKFSWTSKARNAFKYSLTKPYGKHASN